MRKSIKVFIYVLILIVINISCEKDVSRDVIFICEIQSPIDKGEIEQDSIVNITVNLQIENTQLKDVKIYIDSLLLVSSQISPLTYEWNTNGISIDNHIITAIAIDVDENIATDSIEIILTEKQKFLGEQGEITDIEGNVYRTIKIGEQWWMAENLKSTKLNDGSDIPVITENQSWSDLYSPGLSWYNNDENTNKETYGALYNWYTVETEKLCPVGWHVPSDMEWGELETYLIDNGYNYDGTLLENKIAKSLADTFGWVISEEIGSVGNNQLSNNSSGFSGRASGLRSPIGSFHNKGYSSIWWSSSLYTEVENHAWSYTIASKLSQSGTYLGDVKNGFPVRCIKD